MTAAELVIIARCGAPTRRALLFGMAIILPSVLIAWASENSETLDHIALIAFSVGAMGPLVIVSAIIHVWRKLRGHENAPGDVAIAIFVCLAFYGLVAREDYDLRQAGAYVFVGLMLMAVAFIAKARWQPINDLNARMSRAMFKPLSPIRERAADKARHSRGDAAGASISPFLSDNR